MRHLRIDGLQGSRQSLAFVGDNQPQIPPFQPTPIQIHQQPFPGCLTLPPATQKAYYRSQAGRLNSEAEENQQIARNFGDPKPLAAPNHFNIGRNARHYHVIASKYEKQAQNASLLAALNAQAERGEGCFRCHSLHGRGGKIGPDLAIEGTRGRSTAWLISHFRDPQAYSPASVMPAFAHLTSRQLEALASFLQSQKAK